METPHGLGSSSRSGSRRGSQEMPLGSGRGAEGPGSGGSGGSKNSKDKDRDRTLRDAEAQGPESPARVRTPKHPNGAADRGGPAGSQDARRAGPADAKRAGEGAGPRAGPAPTKEGGFFEEYGVNRYQLVEVIGKGSYGVVASAIDSATGEMVAIKKINNVSSTCGCREERRTDQKNRCSSTSPTPSASCARSSWCGC